MKNGFTLVVGAGIALAVSFGAIVMASVNQLDSLTSFYDDSDSQAYPAGQTGLANAGALVYRDLGCAICHTQQVRRPGFGSDTARGWGERQSVARDYIFQPVVQLGQARIGPDLANLAGRKPTPPTETDLYKMLYEGSAGMPAYPFLFRRSSAEGQPSDLAINPQARPGRQLLPTRRGEALVAYLLSLNSPYTYPEAQPAPAPAPSPEGEGAK